MGNEFKGRSSHSAEYFGDTREHWWNEDFLRMIATHWRVQEIGQVLDVGCGVGHWGRALARVLPDKAQVTGVDRDRLWPSQAAAKARATGLAHRFRFAAGTAEKLPFKNGIFDLVTCQTVLMHVRDPKAAVIEMARVTRPGGLIVAAEAINLAGPFVADAVALGDDAEAVASIVEFQLICQRGKGSLGEGTEVIVAALPAMFSDCGLRDIQVRLNDRAHPMIPPYESPAERAMVEEANDWAARKIWIWNRDETLRYFLAGGGKQERFDHLWALATDQVKRVAQAMAEKRYASAGGGLLYLIWGWKEE
jgi:SAM-dependent methyltransferase